MKLRFLASLMVISALAFVFSGTFGCKGTSKPPTANVSGNITLNGKALTGATITFYPSKGGMFPGTVGKGGAYIVTGLPPGDATVAVKNPEGLKEVDLLPRFPGVFKKLVEGFKEKGGEFDLKQLMPEGITPEEKAMVDQYFAQIKKHPDGAAQEKFEPIPAKFSDPKSSGMKVTLKEGDNSDQNFTLKD
jgi:hypothetical protein